MPNYGYHIAMAEGRLVRRIYRALLPQLVQRRIRPARVTPLEVFCYSGEAALPEQVASIRSFLRFAGRPKRFAIVSDGTYSRKSKELLRRIDPSVEVTDLPEVRSDLPPKFRSYLATHSTGKQLSLIMSLPWEGPALYVDSDVLFFPLASDLVEIIGQPGPPAFYLADAQFSGDERLLRSRSEAARPVNAGVLLLFQNLDWSLGIERFSELIGPPSFFSNQTLIHLTMHANQALPFDRGKYVLQLDDQTVYPDKHASSALALRHYVNPVRHKFWMTLWRQ
jgi:hypothetical protein